MTLGALQFAVPLLPRVYIYIQQYNTHTHGQIFFFLGSKKERGTAVQVLLLLKKKIYTETNDR